MLRVPEEVVDLGGPEERGIDDDVRLVVEPDALEGDPAEVAHGVRDARSR